MSNSKEINNKNSLCNPLMHSFKNLSTIYMLQHSIIDVMAKSHRCVLLHEVYSSWIACVRINSKPNTIIKYESIYRNHVSYLKNKPIKEIDRKVVNDFTKHLQSKSLSNKTINDILIVLNMIMSYAAEEYEINTPKITFLRESRKETRYLTLNEQKVFIEYLYMDMDIHKFGTLLALYTGMRIGELCALRWEDITDSAIIIDKTMMRVNTGEHSEVITLPPKSQNSVRVVPFPEELKDMYYKYRKSGYVLSTNRLKFTEPRYMQLKFDKYVKDCRFKDVTFHTLRHTFATRCIEAGVDAKTVSELLGHSNTKITLDRYVHSSFELKQESIKMMQDLLS